MTHSSQRPFQTKINTVGYERTDVGSYVDRLLDADVQVLIDVRERPISRKRGFSKKALCDAVQAAGIRYVHIQALGDPKEGRDAAKSGQHDLFVKIFSAHMRTEAAQNALSELAQSVVGLRVCLTCFERDHTCCHRSMVAEELAALTGGEIIHLTV